MNLTKARFSLPYIYATTEVLGSEWLMARWDMQALEAIWPQFPIGSVMPFHLKLSACLDVFNLFISVTAYLISNSQILNKILVNTVPVLKSLAMQYHFI